MDAPVQVIVGNQSVQKTRPTPGIENFKDGLTVQGGNGPCIEQLQNRRPGILFCDRIMMLEGDVRLPDHLVGNNQLHGWILFMEMLQRSGGFLKISLGVPG